MKALKNIVLLAALGVFLLWVLLHLGEISEGPGGAGRFVLGILFSTLILMRWKAAEAPDAPQRGGIWTVLLLLAGVGGTGMLLLGRILDIGQFVWLGFILVLLASFTWGLPRRYSKDVWLSLFVLYWVHPLPGQVFVPLQFLMQKLSVKGAEFVLQTSNVRCWADNVILYTDWGRFNVPESCSGMSTGVTVLICALGLSAIVRFRWFESLGLVVVGFSQVIVLNAFRIVVMALWAPRMPREWAENFLHDTLGIFLLISIVLVHLEGAWWRIRRVRKKAVAEGVETGQVEEAEKAMPLPRFWELVIRWFPITVGVLVVTAVAVFCVYKRRLSHRVVMIAGVVEGVMESDPEAAEKAARTVLAIRKNDREMRSTFVNILMLRGKHKEALVELDYLEKSGPLSVQNQVVRSWGLMRLGERKEAMAVIAKLPPSAHQWPQVAMLKAEYSVQLDQSVEVGRNVVIASKWHGVMGRVRQLYPYLASREQWHAIVESDNSVAPYTSLAEALLVVRANLSIDHDAGARQAMRRALKKWPDDPRLLENLFRLAENEPGSDWEAGFAALLEKVLPTLDADRLSAQVSRGFRLKRPDLGWLAFRELQERDPTDPALSEMVGRFGGEWFVFRKHHLGLSAADPFAVVDTRPVFHLTRQVAPFKAVWDRVPLGDELSIEDTREVRTRYSKVCLAELEKRKEAKTLTTRMEMSYPVVLAMDGQYDRAHAVLNELAGKYPGRRFDVLFQQAVFFDQEGRWQEAYEKLRTLSQDVGTAGLSGDLMLIGALVNMNQGVGALEVAEEAWLRYPDHPSLRMAIAVIWDVFGFKQDALFWLEGAEIDKQEQARAQLLYDSGRVREAERMVKILQTSITRREGVQPGMRVRPAETVLQVAWPDSPSSVILAKRASEIRGRRNEAKSPYLVKLLALELAWCVKEGKADTSDPVRWEAAGRDRIEQAGALHRLAGLLASQQRLPEARAAAARAVEYLPGSQILWRMLIGFSRGESEVVAKARLACPDDPEIWLADIVIRGRAVRTTDNGQQGEDDRGQTVEEGEEDKELARKRELLGEWYRREMTMAVEKKRFSVAAVIRASDYMLRAGFADVATIGARDAVKRARGFVSAYILGLRCAQATGDLSWALDCAVKGVENSADPTPFYNVIVEIKSAAGSSDADLIAALEYLRRRHAKESRWTEQLSHLYFEKGDAPRALRLLAPVVDKNFGGVRVQSLLLAAEAARLEGRLPDAIRVLEAAHAMYPKDVKILNNLVYTLQFSPAHLTRARELLPSLLEIGKGSFIVLDTAAMVYMRSGKLTLASRYINQALEQLDDKNYAALEVRLNAARILVEQGQLEEATRRLREIQRVVGSSPVIEFGVRDLLTEIHVRERK